MKIIILIGLCILIVGCVHYENYTLNKTVKNKTPIVINSREGIIMENNEGYIDCSCNGELVGRIQVNNCKEIIQIPIT